MIDYFFNKSYFGVKRIFRILFMNFVVILCVFDSVKVDRLLVLMFFIIGLNFVIQKYGIFVLLVIVLLLKEIVILKGILDIEIEMVDIDFQLLLCIMYFVIYQEMEKNIKKFNNKM